MPIDIICPGCWTPVAVPEEYAGRRGRCKKCGGVLEIPAVDPVICALAEMAEEKTTESPFDETDQRPLPPPPPGRPRPKEYRVVTLKDKWFSGKFDPEKIEERINGLARQGYTLKAVATANLPGFGDRDELLIFMER